MPEGTVNRRTAFVLMLGAMGLIGVVLSLGMFLGLRIGRAMGGHTAPATPRIQDTATVVRQIQGLAQLVTVKYVLEKVVIIEDAKWFGENRLIMVVHGVAKAGVDLKRISPGDIEIRGGTLAIQLPKPQLTDVYLDERRTEIVERSTGLLRAMDKDLETEARRQALDRIKVAAVDAGILKEAEERARLQFTELATRAGCTNVEIRLK